MAEQNIFAEEWRRCLREHYKYVIREHDKITEQTLTEVLHRVGFTDSDLRQLYMEATIRADELPNNVLPDTHKLPYQMHPAECTCAACMDTVLDIGHDAEGQPLPAEEVASQDAEPVGNIFAVAKPETKNPLAEEVLQGVEPVSNIFAGVEPNADDADDDKPETPKDAPRQMSMF